MATDTKNEIKNFQSIEEFIHEEPDQALGFSEQWQRILLRNPDAMGLQTTQEIYEYAKKYPEKHIDTRLWIALKSVHDTLPLVRESPKIEEPVEESSEEHEDAHHPLPDEEKREARRDVELIGGNDNYHSIRENLLEEKEKEWKEANPKKYFWSQQNYRASKEFADYTFGSLDNTEAAPLDTEAEKLFKEKHPEEAAKYNEQGVAIDKDGKIKEYDKAEDDPAYLAHQERIEAHTQARLALLGKNATKEEKEALEEKIKAHEYDKWVSKHPELAKKYSATQQSYKDGDKDTHLDEALERYHKRVDLETTKKHLEEFQGRGPGHDIRAVEGKKSFTPSTISQEEAAHRLQLVQEHYENRIKSQPSSGLVSMSGRPLSTSSLPTSTQPRSVPLKPFTNMFRVFSSMSQGNSSQQSSSDGSQTFDNAENAFRAGRTALRIGQWAMRAFGGGGTAAGGTAAAGAAGGAAAAGAGGATAAAGGAAAVAGAPVALVVGIVILVILLIIIVIVVVFGCVLGWFQGCGTFNIEDNIGIKGLNIEKTGPSQVENPGQGKQVTMEYNISVVYSGDEDVLIKDPLPNNTQLVIATGNGCPLYKDSTNLVVMWRLKDCPKPQETGQQIYNFKVILEPLKPDIIVKNSVVASVLGGSSGGPPIEGSSGNACTEPYEGKGYCSVENLKKYFDGNESKALVASMICNKESNSDPAKMNTNCGTNDYSIGLFQINLVAHCPGAYASLSCNNLIDQQKRDACETQYKNPEENIKKMLQLSNNGTEWNKWSVYTVPNGGVQKKLQDCGIN